MRALFCDAGRRLRRDERGVAMVELGFLVPILTLLVVGIVDLSQGISQRFTLQQAVNRSLELLLVTRPSAASNASTVDYSFIRQEAATAAGVPLNQVTLGQYLLCNGARAAASATTCPADQEMARYISLEVRKNYTGTITFGTVTLRANGAMRIQ